jgi:hypothetical protein
MRTTIEIPDELFRQAKIRAAVDGRKLKDLFCAYIEQGLLREPGEQSTAQNDRRRSPPPVGRRAAATGKVIPALTNTEIAEILDEEDAECALRFAGR